MAKYKVCPACGEHNLTNVIECSNCGEDLMNVRVVDEEIERKLMEQTEKPPSQTETVRICECGTHNPPAARKCFACGEDISDIQPTTETATGAAQFVLSSLDGKYAFTITEPVCIVGREQAMQEYLAAKTYVSRNHAKLTIANGELYIINLSQTNFTYVNNEKLTGDSPKLLADGDEVGLGGLCLNGARQDNAAYFLVRIGPCM